VAEGAFVIQELKFRAGFGLISDPDGERFEWVSDREPRDATKAANGDPTGGGGRAAPWPRPWTFGGKLRTSRTDYPGAKTPTEQVLGPHHIPFTLKGTWDDRYNFIGYAVKEMTRFEEMCRRGNMLLMQYQNQAFNVLVTDWNFDYRRKWDIGYSFTVSTHDRPENFDLEDRSPSTARSAAQAVENVQLLVQQALDTQASAPTSATARKPANSESIIDTVAGGLDTIVKAADELGDTFDALSTVVAKPVDQFKRMATQLRTIQGNSTDVINNMIEIKADVELGVKTAKSVLDLESWSRGMRFQLRVLMGEAGEAAADMEERADPEAIALYQPQKNESLYAISRRFYGTPYAWRPIADRNSLRVFVMSGDELLIIPARGEG
jgi:hypothetical protein